MCVLQCSVSCGLGIQRREPVCRRLTSAGQQVMLARRLCDGLSSPPLVRTCRMTTCPSEYTHTHTHTHTHLNIQPDKCTIDLFQTSFIMCTHSYTHIRSTLQICDQIRDSESIQSLHPKWHHVLSKLVYYIGNRVPLVLVKSSALGNRVPFGTYSL